MPALMSQSTLVVVVVIQPLLQRSLLQLPKLYHPVSQQPPGYLLLRGLVFLEGPIQVCGYHRIVVIPIDSVYGNSWNYGDY